MKYNRTVATEMVDKYSIYIDRGVYGEWPLGTMRGHSTGAIEEASAESVLALAAAAVEQHNYWSARPLTDESIHGLSDAVAVIAFAASVLRDKLIPAWAVQTDYKDNWRGRIITWSAPCSAPGRGRAPARAPPRAPRSEPAGPGRPPAPPCSSPAGRA